MRAAEWAVAGIIRRCHAGLDTSTLLGQLVERLGRAVPFDAGLFATTDPATMLVTGGVVVEHGPEDIPRFVGNEYLEQDVMKFRVLAEGSDHVDWLDRSTRGQRDVSSRYRELFRPLGLADELRAAFVDADSCWGVMCITRERDSVPFAEGDARLITQLVPHVAEGLRTSLLLREAGEAEADPDGPGVVVLTDDLNVVAATPAAKRWLAEIGKEEPGVVAGLPLAVYSAVATLKGLESSTARLGVQPRARVRTRTGRWLVVHASFLSEEPAQTAIAVVLEPAARAETMPLVLQAYGLTARECEVTRLVLLGRPTKEIAATLFISEHTVQDHLKSVFEKSGARSRRELVAQVLHEQYAAPS